MFRILHLMFEEQYDELALASDLVMERTCAFGVRVSGTYAACMCLCSICPSVDPAYEIA
jgi:starvation-inducible DNA-binding protein